MLPQERHAPEAHGTTVLCLAGSSALAPAVSGERTIANQGPMVLSDRTGAASQFLHDAPW